MDDQGDSGKLDVLTKRLDVLRRLAEAPAHKRDLVEELEHSRSTINRAVSELEDVNLVDRGSDGIEATVAGRLALERHGTFRRELDDIVDAEPVVAPLPADAPVTVEALAGSDAAVSTEPAPYRPLERFHDRLADARRYRALLPALDDPRHVRLLYEHVVTNGREAELIVTPDLFDALRAEFPRRMSAMAENDGFRVLVGEVPPFAVALADVGTDDDPTPTVSVVVFNEQGGVHGVLENSTPGAVRWAEDRYEESRADAEDRTGALQADADGGTRTGAAGEAAPPPVTGDSLPVSLEREGFVGLDVSYFRDEPVADPTTAWRSGLTLPEVHTGYAVERVRPGGEADDEGRSAATEELTAALRSTLTAGGNCVVVGPPGSGKSTTCKQVACEWYEADRGPVLYRESDRGRPFQAVDDLARTVDAADGHTLVVVEDAVRPVADAVFEAIDRLGDRDDVNFLLDARETEWRDPPGDPTGVSDLEVLTMPALADRDHERLVEHFERTVGQSVDVPVDRLREEVRDEAVAGDDATRGEVLLLLHRLATYADPLADGQTSLEAAVAAVYDEFAGDDLALDVCVLANALNAAGLGVDAGLLYAVADDRLDAVDEALDRLEGRILFPRDEGAYRTVHEAWSVAFLAHLIEGEGEVEAAERFGDCITALLSLADDPDRRDRIASHGNGRLTLAPVTDDPGGWADETVEAIYALGRKRPKLAPLFGDVDGGGVVLPSACSADVAAERPVMLGQMFLAGGDYDRAERAFERLSRDDTDHAIERLLGLSHVAVERGEYDDAVALAEECLSLVEDSDRPVVRGRAHLRLGRARSGLGDYAAASAHNQTALGGFESVGDRRLTASILTNMGRDAYHQQEYDRARDVLERSIEIEQELGDRRGEAYSLDNLGLVARERGEYDRAREYHERSLALARDLGDRQIEAKGLGNLGILFELQGRHDRAREHFQRGLDILEDLGDRRKQLNHHGNLGKIAQNRGEYDRARERFERGLEISRDVGSPHAEALSLRNLGAVARKRGEYDRALENFERSLDISRDLGDSHGEASSLGNIGMVAHRQGNDERAEEHCLRALGIAREIGHLRAETKNLRRLGEVARSRGEFDRAREHLERALDRIEGVGDLEMLGQVRLSRARLALDRGDLETARERVAMAREAFAEMDATHREGRSRRLLGRVTAEMDDHDTAREHWLAALETFEDVGAPQDALATLEHLVDAAHEAGDEGRAEQWCQRAGDLLEEAPDPVADEHREWLRRERSERDGE